MTMVLRLCYKNDLRDAANCSEMLLKTLSALVGILMLAWLALLFSSRAILVNESIENGALREKLLCSYFTGSHRMVKEYWYSQNDRFGRAACPRWERVRLADK
jgi:hypothetical protein